MIKSCSLCLKKSLFCLNVFFLKGFKFNTHTFSIVIKCINYKKYSYNSAQHKNFQTGMLPQLLLSWHFWRLSSVQFSHSVVSDSLRPHGLQHARPPCPSPTPGVHPNPCPSSWWCHPKDHKGHLILCLPLLLLSSIFPSIKVFSSESALRISGQSIGVSASTSVLPVNTQDWSPLGWTGWISL